MELGLQCTKIHRFIQYSPWKCSEIFVQSVLTLEEKEKKNNFLREVAETMKLFGHFFLWISDHG